MAGRYPPAPVVAADWSGAARNEHRHLWVAVADAEGVVVELAPATREAAARRVLAAAEADPRTVAGLDFAFSLPARWLGAWGLDSAPELWAADELREGWLARCPPPFWGRPGRPRPPGPAEDGYRRAELAVRPRPRSTLQLGGAGSVGTASLRGMPWLARLRAAGLAVWPFDRWSTPAVVEVWPRLSVGRLVKSDAAGRAAWVDAHRDRLAPEAARSAAGSDDALDAAAAALDLWARPAPRPGVDDPVIALEGWIDGVPLR